MSDSSKGYQFTFSGNTVTAVYEVERGRVKFEHMERDATWSFDGTRVTQTEWDDGRLETTTYTDANGDGLFVKAAKTYGAAVSAVSRTSDDARWGDAAGPSKPMYPLFQGEEGYRFDIDAKGSVAAVYEMEHGRMQAERIDANEVWTFDGQDVVQVETGFGKVQTNVYVDANQDGVFQKSFELEVQTGANVRTQETYQFQLADGSKATGNTVTEGDTLSGMLELGRRGWKVDRIDANETLQVVQVDGDALILQTQTQWNGRLDFSVFRDDDQDGLWTEIADGETVSAFVTADGSVDLVGIANAGLLQAADALMA